MRQNPPTTYDQVRYASYPVPQAHPDRLATLAVLLGLTPAPVTHCRVLELGCGDGANLIPMAQALPESRFIGLDLAATAVAAGQAQISELQLGNIELRQLDITEAGRDPGEFDYIIAHGVYSWVPEAVQERILALCDELLSPHGVAYISYNVYPGYYLREMVREMMLYHVRAVSDPEQRVSEGLGLIELLLQQYPHQAAAKADLYGAVLIEQIERMTDYRHRTQIFHDELAAINQPVWFHEFMARAAKHNLQYLAEASFSGMQDHIFSPPVRAFLSRFSAAEIVQKEQYLDFLKCRSFRQTLLCRRAAPVTRHVSPGRFSDFYVASPARPATVPPDLRPGVVQEFHGQHGAVLRTDHPLAKAALWQLGEVSPRALRWSELLAVTQARLHEAGTGVQVEGNERSLAEIMLAAYGAGMVQLHLWQPEMVSTVSERPVASPLARWQAQRQNTLTSLLHQAVEPDDELTRELLLLLDGTRDHAALRDELLAGMLDQQATVTLPDGTTHGDRETLRRVIDERLEENLHKCAQMALLVK